VKVIDMDRPILAFVVAGLVTPIAFAAIIYHKGALNEVSYGVMIVVSAIVSFSGVLVLGVPAYSFLRTRNWTALWIAPLVGIRRCNTDLVRLLLSAGSDFIERKFVGGNGGPVRSLPARWHIVAGGPARSVYRHPCMAHRQTGSCGDPRKYR
jgi:hypothetical protein